MESIFSALTGLFLLSGMGASAEIPVPVMAVPQEPVYYSHSVLMTGYNAVPEQTNEDPLVTASGAYSNPEIVAARSRDLAEELPFGTIIEIVAKEDDLKEACGLPLVEQHLGYRVIADTMHARKKNQIDILFDTETAVRVGIKRVNPAVVLGICEDVEIRVIGKIDIKEIPRNQAVLRRVVEEQRLALLQW